MQAKAFTKLLRKVLSKTLRKNLLRRKPVLKEKISFFGKAFFSKERFVLKEKCFLFTYRRERGER
ncbi:MAG: hypothetical protein WA977_06495 [Halobacteriota archaeon]